MKVIGVLCWPMRDEKRIYDQTNEYFTRLIERFGAIPLIIPTFDAKDPVEPILEAVDGLIFTGGNDVAGFLFGEDPHPKSSYIDWRRDDFEMRLYKAARQRGLPIMGVCRGMQLINIAEGGDIYQDLPENRDPYVRHESFEDPLHVTYHRIFNRSGVMRELFGEEIIVNSSHHQALRRVAKGFQATSFSADGMIEAIESDDGNVIALQFHPEYESDQPDSPKLFEYLISRCEDRGR
ncbi:MAG TPA: gamma-glutamyl-gamma-aminobutyrate hydrolase family protein [Tissierellia bacterium]|jgi:putative glutamine amidotransferase|nr:gamma-glutamyl-gamma-aminobutyrate hydrolase family protein [Tissierellia bacterium]